MDEKNTRINYNNLFIIGMEQNSCTENDIKNFDLLPYRKIMFSHIAVKGESVVFMPEFAEKGQVGNPHLEGNLFYKYFRKE